MWMGHGGFGLFELRRQEQLQQLSAVSRLVSARNCSVWSFHSVLNAINTLSAIEISSVYCRYFGYLLHNYSTRRYGDINIL